jgi:hypothetical protein
VTLIVPGSGQLLSVGRGVALDGMVDRLRLVPPAIVRPDKHDLRLLMGWLTAECGVYPYSRRTVATTFEV